MSLKMAKQQPQAVSLKFKSHKLCLEDSFVATIIAWQNSLHTSARSLKYARLAHLTAIRM